MSRTLASRSCALAVFPDFREEEVAGVAAALLGGVRRGDGPGQPRALPGAEAAGQGDHLPVAQVLQRLGGEGGAGAAGAVEDDRVGAVADRVFDAGFEETAGDDGGAGDDALRDLVGFADVDGAGALSEQAAGGEGVDLGDLGLGPVEEVAVGGGHHKLLRVPTTAPRWR